MLKLKIDLKDVNQVAAMAAFFQVLSGAPVVAKRDLYETQAAANLRTEEAPNIFAKKLEEQAVAEKIVEPAFVNPEAESVEPCNADKGLSFSELKEKFPKTKAKSKEAFLEKLGLGEEEEEEDNNADQQESKEDAQTVEITAVEVKKTMSELMNTPDQDLKDARKKLLKGKLTEYGVHNISGVPVEKYADFMDFMGGIE